MNETDFQELFNLYDRSSAERYRKVILKELHRFVYDYPRKRFRATQDQASEFYMATAPRIEQILDEYDPSYNIAFDVYLLVKMKRRYLNFLAKKHKQEMRENINAFYEIKPELKYESVFDHSQEYSAQEDTSIGDILGQLEPEEETVIRLYYGFPLRLKNFRVLFQRNGTRNFFSEFRQYRDSLEQKRAEEKKEKEKLHEKIHYLNLDMQQRLQETETQKNEQKKKRLLERFFSVHRGEPMRVIASLMNTSISYVHRRLKKGNEKIKAALMRESSRTCRKA